MSSSHTSRVGMPLSPTDPTPLSRPSPPARIRPKRLSGTPTPATARTASTSTSTLRSKQTNGEKKEDQRSGASSPERPERQRFTGTIDERTEEELVLASREALQNALRKEWADRETFIARIDEADAAHQQHETRVSEITAAHETLQTRFDSMYKEQATLEADLEEANDMIDRLRASLDEVERQVLQGQRRYVDQENAFEAERLVQQAELQHLQQRVKSLMTERSGRPGNDESNAALQEELVTLSASHQTLVAQLTILADEMHEIKGENARLQEENESWQLLIEDRTLAGTMRGGLGLLSPREEESRESPISAPRSDLTALETLEEQMEMDELHNEMDIHQSIFEKSEASPGLPDKANGMSLALELSHAPQMAEMDALRAEVKALSESNRALSLYCSKILNRIIASGDVENVLSLDYRTRRFGSGRLGSRSRPSVEEMAKEMQQNGPPAVPPRPAMVTEPDQIVPEPESEPTPRKPRPQSMMPTSVPAPLPKATDVKKDAEKDKRARRGFSIDFRSLGFGAAPAEPVKPQLKPLRLASSAAPANSSNNTSPPKSTPSPVVAVAARKLEPQEDDEEDRRERHRLEAALKLMGIDRSTPPTETTPLPVTPNPSVEAPTPSANGAGNWFSRRISRASSQAAVTPPAQSTTPVPDRNSTPLARLSLAIGTGTDPVLAGLVDLNDDMVNNADASAALREYDVREAEQRRLLAEGKKQTEYTTPPKITRERRPTSASESLPASGSSAGSAPSTQSPTTGHRKLESISTLWSMGSSRTSSDFERHE